MGTERCLFVGLRKKFSRKELVVLVRESFITVKLEVLYRIQVSDGRETDSGGNKFDGNREWTSRHTLGIDLKDEDENGEYQ